MASRPPNFLRNLRLQAARNTKPRASQRNISTPAPPQPPKLSQSSPSDARSRLRRLNDRLPRFLRAYTTPLLGAPVTHITSFLMLHELTAIVPLFGLAGAFHYGAWMPDLASQTGETNAFDEGAARFGRWLRKKGWVNEADVKTVAEHETTGSKAVDRAGVQLVLEFATAYAITKALLPARLAASVWATPWFASSVFTPTANLARRLFRRG
ncbi:Uncharacterized protein family FLILHELTA [Penicillium digitatum]|uniref:Uncharacterized protein n=3 Tax=Penicillium digitatum TaxID=36651 RepID=K9FNX0_PEND2|nr:hypothetical protein PDIP_48840 [Penicillium digitatum Pd1]EKV10874.1 hypothetical protein PDIG_53620 [Penicillium digitatum PHI26]EKV13196.1 hypothetical protein PDIP_48840 [Penicillium digitatum Pd1]KAG0155650.1 hypothetical protein PDIDSM_2823 [Penicillium digitatum]QQK43550.1 Uncharacterized protein family FLILHELTA [Penicillium digitatum]